MECDELREKMLNQLDKYRAILNDIVSSNLTIMNILNATHYRPNSDQKQILSDIFNKFRDTPTIIFNEMSELQFDIMECSKHKSILDISGQILNCYHNILSRISSIIMITMPYNIEEDDYGEVFREQ